MRAVAVCAFVALLVAAIAHATPKRYPSGCLRRADINIGYYPYRVTRATSLLVAPRPNAIVRHELPARRRFGVQSLPNPLHLSDPGVPEPTNGYTWGYAKRGGKSGWVASDALQADNPDDPWAYGPAGIDFQAGTDFPDDDEAARFVVGSRVTGVAAVRAATVYLRWAPNSSPRGLLTRGEPVRLLWRSYGSFCVEAAGVRGWLPRSAVEGPSR